MKATTRARAITTYAPTKARGPIDLRLDGNEGRARPPQTISVAELNRYPRAGALEAQLAERHGSSADQVLVTAGADDGLDRVCRAFLEPGRKLALPDPTFEMLPRYATLAGATLVPLPWRDGPFPTEQAIAAQADVIAVVTPNNPTGTVATAEDLRRLSTQCPDALVVVDLAYGELADEDLTAVALTLPNAVVLRTFSKALGLAGLRVGYTLGPAEVIAWLRRVGQPFAVSRVSLELARQHLDDDIADYVTTIRGERAALTDKLRAAELEVPSSQASFVLARGGRADWLRDGLAGLGIAVRSFTDAVRITCPGDAGDHARLLAAIDRVLSPEAILFDMDGVLADVSESYRRAIVDTVASYGVTITLSDVAVAKQAGGANDDWSLTQRLLADRGVTASLAEVTERFELRYQALADGETLLCDRALLETLSARLPLAVVTGRPRQDAERFIAAQDIGGFFSAVICREDAPAMKPDPAPVLAALRALGVTRAWMIGDTVDDVVAARAADVVPLGVGDEALLDAGAARLLSSDLSELAALTQPLGPALGGAA